jgi:colicin import membrane protein
MPRKLKVYQTSQGFYDLAIAAPSMKAALNAWGTERNLFHQGFAREAQGAATIDAALAEPGVVLRRPVGSDQPFSAHSELPSAELLDRTRKAKQQTGHAEPPGHRKADEKSERRASAAFEKEQQRRARERRKEEAAAARDRERRKKAMEKAEAALEDARQDHKKRAAAIDKDLAAIRRQADEEEERWRKVRERLEAALRKASE